MSIELPRLPRGIIDKYRRNQEKKREKKKKTINVYSTFIRHAQINRKKVSKRRWKLYTSPSDSRFFEFQREDARFLATHIRGPR